MTLAQVTEREAMLRRQHCDTPPRERAECDVCFLLDQIAETREIVRACEARMAPGWKPVVEIVGSSPKEGRRVKRREDRGPEGTNASGIQLSVLHGVTIDVLAIVERMLEREIARDSAPADPSDLVQRHKDLADIRAVYDGMYANAVRGPFRSKDDDR